MNELDERLRRTRRMTGTVNGLILAFGGLLIVLAAALINDGRGASGAVFVALFVLFGALVFWLMRR